MLKINVVYSHLFDNGSPKKGMRYQVTNSIKGDYWKSRQPRIIINDIMMFSLVKGSVNFFGDSFMSVSNWREKLLEQIICISE